jgi:hypothetical protein
MKKRVFLHNIFSYALVVFLVATYSLPADAHLNICLGDDGHFEVEAVACQPDQMYSQSKSLAFIDSHHKDCVDYEPYCENNSICDDSFISSGNWIGNFSQQHAAYVIEQTTNEAYTSKINQISYDSSYSYPTDPSAKILRSIVLLI